MIKNLEELKRLRYKNVDFRDCLIPILEDFEKRLTKLEKFKADTLGYYEINETGGMSDIKIGGTNPD